MAVPRNRQTVATLLAAGAAARLSREAMQDLLGDALLFNRDPETVRMLVAAGADPLGIWPGDKNAIHMTVDFVTCFGDHGNDVELLRTLLAMGVNLEHRNNDDQTPLAFAIERGTTRNVRDLCAVGADPNAMCGCGLYCDPGVRPAPTLRLLAGAASRWGIHQLEKTRILLDAGADPHLHDARGLTAAMHVAEELSDAAADPTAWRRALNAVRTSASPDAAATIQDRDRFIQRTSETYAARIQPLTERLKPVDTAFRGSVRISRAKILASLAARRNERIQILALLWAAEDYARLSRSATRRD
jgi:hypothetical protein